MTSMGTTGGWSGCSHWPACLRGAAEQPTAHREDAGPDEDVSHPIPRPDTLDALVESNRGAYVGIVIATPLLDDTVSRACLERKVAVSLGYFSFPALREKHGTPDLSHCRVYVDVHAASDATMLDLIDYYCSQFPANGVTAVVTRIALN